MITRNSSNKAIFTAGDWVGESISVIVFAAQKGRLMGESVWFELNTICVIVRMRTMAISKKIRHTPVTGEGWRH